MGPPASDRCSDMIEVESKFQVADTFELIQRISSRWGARLTQSVEQRDEYFEHPSRSFDESDEALRIRRVVAGEQTSEIQLCYKGPRLDAETKTRAEIECDLSLLSQNSDSSCREILLALGFRPVGVVHKRRQMYEFLEGNRAWTISFDEVSNLGNFVELETLCEDDERLLATTALKRLAEQMDLGSSIRTSYLEMLFA
ncbi:MAG: class IV adenylate cyclase [Planctomyces sp.]|nr:class IV adenylate cyclase [Planctomyces sp.]